MVPIDIHRELKLHAVTNDTTLQDCILHAIKEHLHNECKTVKNISEIAD
jgi:hypothetical protein